MVDTVQLSSVYEAEDGRDLLMIWKIEVMRWAPVEMVEDGMVAVRRGKRWGGAGYVRGAAAEAASRAGRGQ